MKRILVLSLLYLFPLQLRAQNPSHLIVNRSEWLGTFQKSLSKGLCQEIGYVQRCYGLKRNACLSYVNSFTKICSKQVGVPEKFHSYLGIEIGSALGKCVGRSIHQKNNERFNKSDKVCVDYYLWP